MLKTIQKLRMPQGQLRCETFPAQSSASRRRSPSRSSDLAWWIYLLAASRGAKIAGRCRWFSSCSLVGSQLRWALPQLDSALGKGACGRFPEVRSCISIPCEDPRSFATQRRTQGFGHVARKGHRDCITLGMPWVRRLNLDLMPRHPPPVGGDLASYDVSRFQRWASHPLTTVHERVVYLRARLTFFLFCGRQHPKLTMIPTPAGNFYSISNPGKNPARIFFAQGNEMVAGTAGGDVSS